MRRVNNFWIWGSLLLLLGSLLSGVVAARRPTAPTIRLKEIARIQGVRHNQLNGMGLVVGLNGTGDSSKANAAMIATTLAKWGITVNSKDLKAKNVAAVMLTAKLPPYRHKGDTIDVQVSSFANAKSLQGGILLQSPLFGADGQIYAVAQGPVYVGGYSISAKGASESKNIATVGIVAGGGIVEREVPNGTNFNSRINLLLNHPDFTTAARLAKTINENLSPGGAKALDMGLIEVLIPIERANDPIGFIAELEALPVTPDGIAKVVVNERNGTVMVGDKVRIAPVAVTHKNTTVKIATTTEVSQPKSLSKGKTKTTKASKIDVYAEPGQLIMLQEGSSIGAVVRALNAVGSTPQDIIAILVAIQNAGALYGILEFQ